MSRTARGRPRRAAERLRSGLWLVPFGYFVFLVVQVERAPRPGVVPADEGDRRFGVALALRKQIYARLVDKEPAFKQRALRFADAWSQADDFHIQLGSFINQVAGEQRLNVTQVFLIYDEGLRAGWRGSDGRKLEGNWPKFVPRIN